MLSSALLFLHMLTSGLIEWMKQVSKPAYGPDDTHLLLDLARSRRELIAENTLLRQQLIILKRGQRDRSVSNSDRLRLLFWARLTPNWRQALHIVQPETLLRWHRDLFPLAWRWKTKTDKRTPRVSRQVIALIKEMASENHTWGAERIRGELLKLGISLSKRTIQKYISNLRRPSPSGQTWSIFLRNHAPNIWACDFIQVYDIFFRCLFVFVVIEHSSRRIVHVATTAHPTDAWVSQQLKEATPWNRKPRFLIRDNDGKYGQRFSAVAKASGIQEIRTPVRGPDANAICERFVGTLRRECLDHVLILKEKHLRTISSEFVAYYNACRPHQSLNQDIPEPQPEQLTSGKVMAFPVLGGLHHDYRRVA